MHVRPLKDWLVVKLDPIQEMTASGLLALPQSTSGVERQRTATVLRVGPGRRLESKKGTVVVPIDLLPGDKVIFFRENLEHQQGKEVLRILQELEEDTGMIRADDVLLVQRGGAS